MPWDDIKSPGDGLTASEWNAHVTDQKDCVKMSSYREIKGNTGAISPGVKTVCSAVIGQDGKRGLLLGGIVRGVQTLTAGKKATIYVSKYDGASWHLIDKYDLTKDSELESNIGSAAHDDYMKIEVEHDDTGNNRTFHYVFVIQDIE